MRKFLKCFKEFVLPSVSLLNKITEGNTDIMKTANLLFIKMEVRQRTWCLFTICIYNRAFHIQEGELFVWLMKKMFILQHQNSTYSETVYIFACPLFPPSILCFDGEFIGCALWCSFFMPKKNRSIQLIEFQFEERTMYRFRVIGVNISWKLRKWIFLSPLSANCSI